MKKKPVQEKARFDRGGRFSTAEPKSSSKSTAVPNETVAATPPAPPATTPASAVATAPATTSSAAATPTTLTPAKARAVASSGKVSSGKPRKVKREKVRFGQAPRNSLPAAPSDALVDKGLGRTDSIGPGELAAPGAVMAPTETTTQFSASSDPDPLANKVVVTGKTRYSSRAKTEAATKAAVKTVKSKDKAVATPVAASSDEKASQAVQAAPLGFKRRYRKEKKPVKVKGAPKERIQQKPKEPAPPPVEATPYRRPADEAPATKTPASSDSTTLPPSSAPAPGAQQSTTPATPGSPIPTPAQN